MKHSGGLAQLAIMVWLSWLALLGLMFWMLRWNAWHPHFLPVTAVMVVMLSATLALLVTCGRRLIAGSRRTNAFRWLLLGLPPVAFQAGYFMYGCHVGYGRQLDLNLPLRMLIPLGESMLDLAARFPYPVRTQGERVVMISAPMGHAREQVTAMDWHIRALEARLGRTGTQRVHWVRGPLLGLRGKALYGMCFGSLPGENHAEAENLSRLDRHEVAHVVLSQFCSTDFDPPAAFMEGWAEVASGIDPNALILRAWAPRQEGKTLSLRQLVSSDWYGRHEWPVYRDGALLVDFILRRFGPARFVELYATTRRATFAADCLRILGVSVDELDQALAADIERSIGPQGFHGFCLRSLKLGSGVDAGRWEQLVGGYMAAAKRLAAPYTHAELTAEEISTYTDAAGKPTNDVRNFRLLRSGPFRALKMRHPGIEQVYLAKPEGSWRAERKLPAGDWEIRDQPDWTAEQAFKFVASEIDRREPCGRVAIPLISLGDMISTVADPLSLEVAQLERLSESGRPMIRIRFEGRQPGNPLFRSMTLELAAQDHSLISAETVRDSGETWHSAIAYDLHAGVPVVREARSEGRGPGSHHSELVVKVTSSRFGPVQDSDFSAQSLLAGANVRHLPPEPEPMPPSEGLSFMSLYRLPIALGLISLLGGVGLSFWENRTTIER